jgi:hypothetical protein
MPLGVSGLSHFHVSSISLFNSSEQSYSICDMSAMELNPSEKISRFRIPM